MVNIISNNNIIINISRFINCITLKKRTFSVSKYFIMKLSWLFEKSGYNNKNKTKDQLWSLKVAQPVGNKIF